MRYLARVPGVVISVAVIAAALALYRARPFPMEQLEVLVRESIFRLRGPVSPDGRIAIVAVDKEAIRDVGKWPWPRERIAELIDRIAAEKPALIVLDVLFSDEGGGGDEGDRRLAESIRRAGNVVLPYLFFLNREEARHQSQRSIEAGLACVKGSEFNQVVSVGGGDETPRRAFQMSGIEAPAPVFARAARATGFFNIVPEPSSAYGNIPLVIYANLNFQPRPCQSLAVSAARECLRGQTRLAIREGMIEAVAIGDLTVETDPRGCMGINYYGPASVFRTVSAATVMAGSGGGLAGKIVFVGGTSLGDFETKATPFEAVAYSVQIQANAVDNILTGRHLRETYVSFVVSCIAVIAPALFLGVFIPRQRKASVGLLATPCVVAFLLAADYLLFTRLLLRISVVYGVFSAVATYLLVSLHGFIVQEWQGGRFALAVNEVTQAITSVLDLDEILPRILGCLAEFIHAERGALLLFEGAGEGQKLEVKALVGMPASALDEAGFAPSRALIQRAADRKEPIIVGGRGRRRGDGEGPRSALCLPLTQKGRLLGIIYADRRERGFAFSARHLPILRSFAAQAAIAIDNARLHTYLLKREERLQSEYLALKQGGGAGEGRRFPAIIGNSPAMQRVFALIEKALDSDVTVLVLGETGTGKEVIARAIHSCGSRRDKPFVAQNCASLPESLLESELFGHKRGAFTGAVADKKGLFEIADGGTIFLDEIGEMSIGTQAKILRVLEGGMIRPLGDTREKKVDVRIISATNRDLAREIGEKKFREDLFYRLNVFPIHVPPLRERREDIPLLAGHFLSVHSAKLDRKLKGFSAEAMDALAAHDYQGNVRELENEIERLAVLAGEGDMITADLLSPAFKTERAAGREGFMIAQGVSLGEFLRSAERSYIREVLKQCAGSRTAAAQRLGISRVTLHKKLRDLELS